MAKIIIDTDTISLSYDTLHWLCTHGTVLSDANMICISKDQYERAKLLLKVTKELLEKQEKSPYVLNLLAETVFYDNADCDGYSLKEDIEYWFDEEEQSTSLKET